MVWKFVVKVKMLNVKSMPETLNIRKFSNSDTKQQMQETIYREITKLLQSNTEPKEKWSNIEEEIRTVSSKFLKSDKRKKKDWMTEKILDMMEEKRLYKDKDTAKYHRRIRDWNN